jgi:flagella basal body P-ring formation protein FlgA
MKTLFTAILSLFLLMPAALLQAEAEPRVIELEELENIFHEIVLENAPWPTDDLEIIDFTARPGSVTLPARSYDIQVLQAPQKEHLGRKVVTIAILVDGEEFQRVRMIGDLQLYGQVICTTKRLQRHALIEEADVSAVRHNITMLDSGALMKPQDAIGKRLRTSLRPGAILYAHLLESPPMVQRGDLVTIIAESNVIRVTVPGEARNAGALGDLVRVKNLMSRKEIFAKVLGSGMVETEF